jgi:hypothetical protein
MTSRVSKYVAKFQFSFNKQVCLININMCLYIVLLAYLTSTES